MMLGYGYIPDLDIANYLQTKLLKDQLDRCPISHQEAFEYCTNLASEFLENDYYNVKDIPITICLECFRYGNYDRINNDIENFKRKVGDNGKKFIAKCLELGIHWLVMNSHGVVLGYKDKPVKMYTDVWLSHSMCYYNDVRPPSSIRYQMKPEDEYPLSIDGLLEGVQ